MNAQKIKITADLEKIIQHLKLHWGDPKAFPMCGKSKWSVNNEVYELRQFKGDTFFGPYLYQPLAAVICQICGFTAFINLNVVGQPESEWKKEEVE